MENNPLENEEILVTNIKLKEIEWSGGKFKQYNVSCNADKGIYYTLPIKKKDGEFTKVYEMYKLNKAKLDDNFAEDHPVRIKVAYSEKVAEKEYEGKKNIFRYRTIRHMEIVAGEGEQPEPTVKPKEEANTEEISIEDIPF